ATSHSCSACRPPTVVTNVRTSRRTPPASVIRTQATTVCLCTSSPAQRAWMISIVASSGSAGVTSLGVAIYQTCSRPSGGPPQQSRVRTGRRVHTCYRATRTTHSSTSVPAPATYQVPASPVDPRGRCSLVTERAKNSARTPEIGGYVNFGLISAIFPDRRDHHAGEGLRCQLRDAGARRRHHDAQPLR